ncbi:MAG TPA: hypothetical protein VIL37_15930 [Natronosporangium sp.]
MRLLERLSGDADAGVHYVVGNTGMAGGEGWLNDLSGAHESVVNHTKEWLSELENPAASVSAGAVDRALTYYKGTDQANAAQLDATIDSYASMLDISNPGTDYWIRHADVPAFGDVVEPEDAYATPPDYNDHEDFRYQPTYYDMISIASMARDAIFKATEFLASIGWLERAYDPYELVLKPVVGDWAGFRRCADVFRNIADALIDMCSNLYHAQLCMSTAWRGNAADACNVHLGRLHDGIADAYQPLRAIADEYEQAANGQAEFRTTVATLISDLIDAAIVLAIAIAGGSATSWTGIGAVIGGIVGLAEAYTIIRIIRTIVDLHVRIDAVIAAVKGSMNDFGQLQASDFYLPKLPLVDDEPSALDVLPS